MQNKRIEKDSKQINKIVEMLNSITFQFEKKFFQNFDDNENDIIYLNKHIRRIPLGREEILDSISEDSNDEYSQQDQDPQNQELSKNDQKFDDQLPYNENINQQQDEHQVQNNNNQDKNKNQNKEINKQISLKEYDQQQEEQQEEQIIQKITENQDNQNNSKRDNQNKDELETTFKKENSNSGDETKPVQKKTIVPSCRVIFNTQKQRFQCTHCHTSYKSIDTLLKHQVKFHKRKLKKF